MFRGIDFATGNKICLTLTNGTHVLGYVKDVCYHLKREYILVGTMDGNRVVFLCNVVTYGVIA